MEKIFIAFAVIFTLSGCVQNSKNPQSSVIENKTLRVGFCPTMQEEALDFKRINQNFELVEFGSASEVLKNLKLKNIEAGLIGRKAKKAETTKNTKERKLQKNGYTLVNVQKGIIIEQELRDLQINTCLNKQVEGLYPELNLNFRDCDYRNNQPWLISWNDYFDDLELLIPVNENGEKIKKFRAAHLYTLLSLDNFIF